MNRDEQSLIQNLFGKLSEAERSAPPRDPEADRFIGESVARQPGAPYYMAQTIIVQEQALEAAQARIQELEAQGSRPSSGGLLGSLFGSGSQQPPRAPQQRSGAYAQTNRTDAGRAGASGAWGGSGAHGAGAGRSMGGGGGGFLAGAAQTAVGVAGGVMLGSMLGGMFAGENPIEGAGDALADAGDAVETEVADAGDAMGFDDFGGGFEDI